MNSDFCLLHSEPCEVTVHAQGKKKKKKVENVKRRNAGHRLSSQTLTQSLSLVRKSKVLFLSSVILKYDYINVLIYFGNIKMKYIKKYIIQRITLSVVVLSYLNCFHVFFKTQNCCIVVNR